jgi:aldehyde:ferredoxin oxidoreductase
MASLAGWVGKTLRVNLSTGKISSEPTVERFKDYIGGAGVGFKVLWDEVPAKTGAFDEANKIVLGTGPLTGTSAPTGGRGTATFISPMSYPWELVVNAHFGGYWAPELKYAGWDNIIVEGKADKPVYIAIVDDKVEIRDARHIWGSGTARTTQEICSAMGPETQVLATGQAGENLVRESGMICSFNHFGGSGLGAVAGSKNLKAVAVKGSGSINIGADPDAWHDNIRFIQSIMGANNNHVVPATPQSWAEFHANTRWTARRGLYWGAAEPPVETGECSADDLSRQGYRTMKTVFDLGPIAEKYTVRMGGCHACPLRCYGHVNVPSVAAKYGGEPKTVGTCTGWHGNSVFKSFPDGSRGQTNLEAAVIGNRLANDYGVFNNYGLMQRSFKWAFDKGIIKAKLGKAEYDAIGFDKFEKSDPSFLFEFYRRMAYKEGEFGATMAEGAGRMAARWGFGQDYYDDFGIAHWKMGHPKHHSNENGGQVGVIINWAYNRDCMTHSHINFYANGLPLNINKQIGEAVWGSADAVDALTDIKPMNRHKAVFAKWSLVRQILHDSMTLCNWVYPLIASPHKSRNYMGDNGAEAKMFSLATGIETSTEELDTMGERIFNLHRALTIRDMGTKEMRVEHDTTPNWAFDYPANAVPFTPGNYKMDRGDIELAKNMFYMEMGWDGATGTPSRYTYERLGMKDVADGLAKMNLL